MPPLKETTKRKRLLDAASDWLKDAGVDVEAAIPAEAIEKAIEEPAESVLEKIKEAEAALIYFKTNGSQFKWKTCQTCGEAFAYRWEVDSITRCSVKCYEIALAEIGLKWDPNREQSRRWGPAAPVVVPPGALKVLSEKIDSQEDQPVQTSPSSSL